MKRSDLIKLIVAIAGLAIAGLLIAWQLSDSRPKQDTTAAQVQEAEPGTRGGARMAPERKK